MANNKVVLGNETLIDLTGDTVTPQTLLAGATAHDNRGEQIQGAVVVPEELNDLDDVDNNSPQEGDVLVSDENGVYQNQPKSLYPSAPITTWAEYQQLVEDDEDDPDAEYYIDDIDVAEAYYVETSGQTALTGATSLTFTNSHIKPTADIRILAEPASCKVSTNPQYKVSAKLSSVGNGTATITFPALAENTEFWLLIECPLPVTVDPPYIYNTGEHIVGEWIDGKTLYEMTMPLTGGSSTTQTNVINIDSYVGSVDKIFKHEVMAIRTNGTTIDSEFFNGISDFFILLVQKHNNSCSVRYNASILYQTVYVTVRYTKP